jgi:hypothetical protein
VDEEELRRLMYSWDLRIVPDALVFPRSPFSGGWAPERSIAVTPGQTYSFTVGSAGGGAGSFSWKVPPGVTSINVQCFGGGGGGGNSYPIRNAGS